MSDAAKQFDWRKIHKELEGRLALTGVTFEGNEARANALLRERGSQLAKVPSDRHGETSLPRMLVFRAAGERFGLALKCANEVTPMPRAALLQKSPSGLLGIIHWRGEFVSMFSAAAVFGLEGTASHPEGDVIVLRDGEPRAALLVDRCEQINGFDPAKLQAPDRLRTRQAGLFKGATSDAVFVVDDERLKARLQEGFHGV